MDSSAAQQPEGDSKSDPEQIFTQNNIAKHDAKLESPKIAAANMFSLPQSPTKRVLHIETTQQVRRDSSLPRSFSRQITRRSTFSPPRQRAKPLVPEILSTNPASTAKIRREVLDLFVTITTQESSPLRFPKFPPPDDSQMNNRHTSLTMGSEKCVDILKMEPGRSRSLSRTPNFYSMDWKRQKHLLDRELRRLLKWDIDFRTHDNEIYELHNDGHASISQIIENSFLSIGKILTEVLESDSGFETHVEYINLLSKDKPLPAEFTTVEKDDDPLDKIRTVINGLFDILQPLQRKKRKRSEVRSMPDLASLDPLPASMFIRPGADVKAVEDMGKPMSPQTERQVHLSVEGLEGSTSENKMSRSDTDRPASPTKSESQSAKKLKSEDRETHPKSRIVLKIADRLDAFREARRSSLPASVDTVRPQIRRVATSDIPIDVFQRLSLEDSQPRSESFENMHLDSASSANITNEILALARIEESSQHVQSDAAACCSQSDSELSQTLQRFDSIVALVTGLPDWQVFTAPGQGHHAKSAVSVIHFSLLQEAVQCAISVSQTIHEILGGVLVVFNARKLKTTRSEIEFFSACIRRLSELREGVEIDIQSFQAQFQRIVSKLQTLSAGIKPTAASEQDKIDSDEDKVDSEEDIPLPSTENSDGALNSIDNTEISTSISNFCFRKYYPLSIAFQLFSITDDTPLDPAELAKRDITDGLKSQTVRDLFKQRDLEMPD